MKLRSYPYLLCLLLTLVACQPIQRPTTATLPVLSATAQTGVNGETITLQALPAAPVAQYAGLEFQLDTNVTVENPYDPAQIDILVHFSGPDGARLTVPAFWMQPYDPSSQ